MNDEKVLAKGNFERIGEQESFLTHKVNGNAYLIKTPVMNHTEALKIILEQFMNEEYKVIDSLKEISMFFSVSIDELLSSEKLLFIAEKEIF